MFSQVSQKEYIDDFQGPMDHMPKFKMGVLALWIIPIIGQIVFISHLIHTNKKVKKHVEKVFKDFNEKYEKSRGVRLGLTKTMQMTPKGNRMVETIQVTVKQPGVPIPGIPLFPLSKEGLMAVQAYQQGVQTGTPMAAPPMPPAYGSAPMAPVEPAYPAPASPTPAGYPPAAPAAAAAAAAADFPPGYEVDPYAPYPM